MLRMLVGTLAVSIGLTGASVAQEPDPLQGQGDRYMGMITKIDEDTTAITVKLKGKEGDPEETRDFRLTENTRIINRDGDLAAFADLKVGDSVEVLVREGKVVEVQQTKEPDREETDPNPDR